MNLRDAIAPDLAERYGRLAGEHALRGCGDFSHGLAGCRCTCADHPCGALPPAPAPSCASCGGAGFLRGRMRREGMELISTLVKCPNCDIGAPSLAPMLPWEHRDRYVLGSIDDREPEGAAIHRWLLFETDAYPFLTLVGLRGRGKTHAAITLGMALARRGKRVEFYTASTLLSNVRRTFGHDDRSAEQVLYHALTDDAFILDDLGAEQRTDFADAELLRLMDARYLARRITIVTTNTLAYPDEDRLWSRMRDRSLSRTILMKGRDWRRG